MKRKEQLPEIMTAKEVCDCLHIGIATLHRYINKGRITPLPANPVHLKRYRLLFHRSDVEALLSKSPTPPPPPSAAS